MGVGSCVSECVCVHCNALLRTATHCNTLQHTRTYCNILQHTTTQCNTLQHTATHRNTLQHIATHTAKNVHIYVCITLYLACTYTSAYCNTETRESKCKDARCSASLGSLVWRDAGPEMQRCRSRDVEMQEPLYLVYMFIYTHNIYLYIYI